MRLKLICAVLVGLLVIAPGCGSKKKSTSTTKTTTTSASGGSTLTATDCTQLLAVNETIAAALQGNIPSDVGTMPARLQVVAGKAPAKLKPDFEILGQAAAKFAGLHLKIKPGAKPTPEQTAAITAALSTLNLAEVQTAAAEIHSWAAQVCKK